MATTKEAIDKNISARTEAIRRALAEVSGEVKELADMVTGKPKKKMAKQAHLLMDQADTFLLTIEIMAKAEK
jgi:hypothetical protein